MVQDSNQEIADHPKKTLSKRKKIVVIIATVTVLFIGILIAFWLLIFSKSPLSTSQIINNAERLVNNGNIKTAITTYDNAIQNTKDPYQKSLLLMSEATVYFNNKEYDKALSAAKKSEVFNQNSSIDQFIAETYETKGDSQNAVTYYQKAISHADKSLPLFQDDIQYYQSKIDALSGITN